jgi:hypothetical protein
MRVSVLAATAFIAIAGLGSAPDPADPLQASPGEAGRIVDGALGARSLADAATATRPAGSRQGTRLAGTFVGNPD